jgi:hypothetical protein
LDEVIQTLGCLDEKQKQHAPCEQRMSNDAKNRRSFRRLPIDSAIEIWTDHQSWEGVLVNQSIGGVGLLLKSKPELSVGDEIRACYDDTEAFGFVRHIRQQSGAAYVGISWDQRELPRKGRRSDATFFVNGPIEVVCRSCVTNSDGNVTFKLWDGTEFSTSENQVKKRAIAEREKKLNGNLDELCMLTKLYRLGEISSPIVALERVIDFEFAR